MVSWYSGYLYDLWWSSLSEEQKALVEECNRVEKERIDRELYTSLLKFGMISTLLKRYPGYVDVYDEYGLPM